LFIGALVNLPYALSGYIELIPGTIDQFRVVPTSLGSSRFYRLYLIILNWIQIGLSFPILIIINTIVIAKFKNYIQNRGKIVIVLNRNSTIIQTQFRNVKIEESARSNSITPCRTQSRLNNTYSFQDRINIKRKKLKSKKLIDRNFTIMILVASCIYLFARLFTLISISFNQINQLTGRPTSLFNTYLNLIDFFISITYLGY
jgi:hypothetical protein